MTRITFAASLLYAALTHCQARALEPPARFAIVIGNNHPESPKQLTLRYADDDAVATHLLLQEADTDSVLLVSPDLETHELYPHLSHVEATAAQLERVTEQLVDKVRAVAGRSELFVFYSGHGDEDDAGEGYVLLEGGRRFTRGMLISLLSRVGASRNHVIIDACKSSLFLFNRGPGGDHRPYTGQPLAISSPALRASTGFVLSTSSGRDSHEWERFHGGILSHELRSALRGAADLDNDGQVTYREVRGFLGNANESIHPRFQPDFLVVPPGNPRGEQTMLSWSCPASVELTASSWGHMYVESSRGERIADLHPAPDRSTFLWTPAERPLFVRRHDERFEVAVAGSGGTQRVDSNAARTPAIAQRGASSLAFENLFASPFVASDLERFARPPRRDIEPRTPPTEAPDRTATWIVLSGAAVFGASAITLGILTVQQHDAYEKLLSSCPECDRRSSGEAAKGRTLQTLTNISIGLSGTAAAAALVLFFIEPSWTSDSTRLSLVPGGVGIEGRM
ncbi:MAG TPA: caspase family protein [Polyangiales bacterium]|nr:caspase family protein [Polyangiales bacterium]